MLKPSQIAISLIGVIAKHSANIPQLLNRFQSVASALLEGSIASNRRQKTKLIGCFGNATDIIKMMSARFAKRVIDYEKIRQNATPDLTAAIRSDLG